MAKPRRFDRGNEGHFGLASAPMTTGLPPEFKPSAIDGENLEKRQYMARAPLSGANGQTRAEDDSLYVPVGAVKRLGGR